MSATDPAALRELAQGLTVPTIAEAPLGLVARLPESVDLTRMDGPFVRVVTVDLGGAAPRIWFSECFGFAPTQHLARLDAEVTHIPLPVDQLAAVRAALEGAAAELERLTAELGRARADCDDLRTSVVDLDQMVVDTRAERERVRVNLNQLAADRTVERDRARDAAAALEAKNAELREFVRWVHGPFRADITDAQVVDAILEQATAVLARTGPLRAETDGGDDRG